MLIKRIIIIFITLASYSFSAHAQQNSEQEQRGRLKWGLSGGSNYSLMDVDSVKTDGVFLPFLGFHFGYQISPKLKAYSIFQFSMRGANSYSPVYKFRGEYLDFKALGQYELTKGVDVVAGVQYSALLNSYYQRGGLSFLSDILRYNMSGYSSQTEILAGISFEPFRDVEVSFEYTVPMDNLDYSNFQAVLRIDLAHFSPQKRSQKYTDLQEALDNPESVRRLVLHRKDLDSLPPEIGQLENLEYLVLDGNNLKTLPEEIGQLKKLYYLSVKFNDLRELPASIGELENLEELELDHNKLKSIPESIGNLGNLRYLNIGKNDLNHLPVRLWECTSLVELDIANSGTMLQIPGGIQNLNQLEILRIDRSTQFPFMARDVNSRLKVIVE
jgi:hypothetical protein